MKKNFWRTSKKALSVFMAVMMLMSCWVFVPAEHNHAAAADTTSATYQYNKSKLDGINTNVDSTMPTTVGRFSGQGVADSDAEVTNYGTTYYKNVFYSPTVNGADDYAAYINPGQTAVDSLKVFYPETVLIYDGTTAPEMGVVFGADAGSNHQIVVKSVSMSANANGMSFGYTYWKGVTTDNLQFYDNMAEGNDLASTTGALVGAYQKTSASKGKWEFFANTIKFTGSMSANEFVRTITPTWSFFGDAYNKKTFSTSYAFQDTTYSQAATKKIYVMNVKAYRDFLTTINSDISVILQNADMYTPDSVQNYVNAANALINLNPKNVAQSVTAVTTWATNMTNAISTYNTAKNSLKNRNFDVTYENLFSITDWATSASPNFQSSTTAEILVENNDTIKIYKSAEGGEVTTGSSYPNAHVATRYSIPVTGGENYTISIDIADNSSVNGTANGEVFLFWYDLNNNPVNNTAGSSTFNNFGFSGVGNHKTTVTAPAGAAKAEIRFDNDCPSSGSTLRFKNIAVYEAGRESGATFAKRTQAVAYNTALSGNLGVPTRDGYEFNGWYFDNNSNGVKDSGEEVTDAAGNVTNGLTMNKHYNLYADWKILPSDIGYDNMFSVAEWAKTTSTNPNNAANGTISYDAIAGTITVESTANGEVYTSYGSDGYTIAVKPEKEYVFETSLSFLSGANGQMFIFCYDANGNSVTGPTDLSTGTVASAQHIGIYPKTAGKHQIIFKTPANCYKLRIRVGATDVGVKAVYSNIGIYEKAAYDAYAKNYATVRLPFYVGDTTQLSHVPTRDGYAFDGWYTADGNKITSVEGLAASATVYAHWIQLFTVTFVDGDGTVLKTQQVAPGNSATAPASAAKTPDDDYEYVFAGWDKDYENVQSDLVVNATFTTAEHSDIRYSVETPPSCDDNGWIIKYCATCDYYWNNGEKFEDTAGEIAGKLGHNFKNIVDGSSTGLDGYHLLDCTRCNETKEEGHNFQLDADHQATSATCTIPGKTYYICGCGQEKTEEGTTNPNNHVNTELRGVVAAECEKPGFSGDKYCKDCNTKLESGSETAALEHVYTNYVYNNDATCTADGTKTAECDNNCGKKDTIDAAGTMIPHSFTNYVSNGDAKCEKDGTKTAKCDYNCGAEKTVTDEGSALAHDYTGTVKDNEDGTHEFLCKNGCGTYGAKVDCSTWTPDGDNCKCTVCGYTKDHTWGAWQKHEDNTDLSAGKMTHTCTVCGATETSGCEYDEKSHTDANCTSPERTELECSKCGHGYTVIGDPAKGHNFTQTAGVKNNNDGTHSFYCENNCGNIGIGTEVGAKATCSDWAYSSIAGDKHTATCNVCGYEKTENCSGGTATCTAKAECQYCGEEYGDLKDHVLTGTEKHLKKATDATCIANETYYKYCIGCENVFSDTETYEKPDTMTAHDYTCTDEYLYIATQAKCEVNETYYAYCSNADCKKSSEDASNTYEKAGTALVHNWVDAKHNDGELTHTFTCSNTNTDGWSCDETMTANCADTAISYDTVPATCISEGYDIVQCYVCNHTWNINYVPALGHDYTEKVYDAAHLKAAANCEHANIYWYDCSRCDRSAEEITEDEVYTGQATFINGEVRKHNWVNVVADEYLISAATCTAAAKYYASCSYADCAKSAKDVDGEAERKFSSGSALGHDWVKPADDVLASYIATEPDCVTNATYYYTCSRAADCGCTTSKGVTDETWVKEKSNSGHNMTHTDAKAADCFEAGNYEFWYCSNCNKYYKDADGNEAFTGQSATVIKKRDHNLKKVDYKAATCEVDGNPEYFYCQYEGCGYTTLPADISGYKAKGHNFNGDYYCDTVLNYHAQFCSNANCDKVTLTDAEGNPYTVNTFGMIIDGEQVKYSVTYDELDTPVIVGGEPCEFTYEAETKDGVHSHKLACECGNNATKIYADDETFVNKVDATCTTGGYENHECPDCGKTWTKNHVGKTGHDYADTATSNNDGKTHYYACLNGCGDKSKTELCSGGTSTCKDKAVCEKCGQSYGETSDHSYVTDWVYQEDATCGKNGTEKNTCDVCKTVVTREAKGTALAHEMTPFDYTVPEKLEAILAAAGIVIKAPDCKNEGLALSYCVNCDAYDTSITKRDTSTHKYETDENGNDIWILVGGDCTTGMTFKKVCTLCGDSEVKVEAKEHEWTDIVVVETTCIKLGYKVQKCINCAFTQTIRDSEYADHDYEVTEEIAATCCEPAYTVSTCKLCGDTSKAEVEGSKALGHEDVKAEDLVKWYANPGTCDVAGYVEHYRSTCGTCFLLKDGKFVEADFKTEIQYVLGHDFNKDGICTRCSAHKDGEGAHSCLCHKTNWFMKLIYKIVRFFWKLFGINKVCSCGATHY